MTGSPRRPRREAWTVFGRWRQPPKAHRRLGVALLLLALILTLLWARAPRAPLDADPGAGEPAPMSRFVSTPAFTDADRHSA